ncbi:TonB-dependent receptor [uncultured Paraglaciecola sp.]|uniref:TonB-dependent receptor n=1 Tax=uncultured Paraglaciecola sp. TaxID=1765024 RepID=UPI0026367E87|nr:TonB-dependent receptor [uncultured Paraglaciecola sp.]
MNPNVCFLTLMLVSTAVLGQTSPQPIEQITVTATRTSQSILDVAGNISSLDDKSLRQIEQQHINQTLVRIPGAWVSRGNGQEHLTAIRSPVLTGAGGCGAFFLAQDGISLRAPGFCNINQLFDANTEQAASLEVLRGPASTIYGSNAVHGVINVLTPNPFETDRSSLSLAIGPHDYTRGTFSVSKAGEQHGFLLYGNLTTDAGYLDNSGFDQQKVNLIHQYQDANWQVKNVIAVTNLNQETAGFISGFEMYKDAILKKQNPNPEAFRDSQSMRAYSQVSYVANHTSRFTVTPYIRWTDMQFLQHYLPWQPLEENSQSSAGVQVQFQKDSGDLRWLSGVDIDYTQGQLTETQEQDFSPSLPAGFHYDYQVNASVYSPFAQLQWRATQHLLLSAGLRYEHTQYDYDNRLSTGSACAQDVDNCRFTRPEDQVIEYDEWSYQLNANYALNKDNRLYAQYSIGYRAPQATELFRLQAGQTVADLEAENLDAFELGVRGQDQAFFYDLTLFAMEKDNFIFQDTNKQNVSNGETSHRGIELALRYQWQQFYLSGNGTIAKHKYDSNLTLSRTNIKGNEIDTAPKHMGSVQLGWRVDSGEFIELEWVHQGNYFLNPENTAEYSGHNLLNLRAGWQINNQLNISARITNLSNEDYAERADFGFGSYRYFVGEARAIYATIQYDF